MSDQPTITIPTSILDQDLSTAEIGAIAILMCFPYTSSVIKNLWIQDRTFASSMLSLDAKQIISIKDDVATINFENL